MNEAAKETYGGQEPGKRVTVHLRHDVVNAIHDLGETLGMRNSEVIATAVRHLSFTVDQIEEGKSVAIIDHKGEARPHLHIELLGLHGKTAHSHRARKISHEADKAHEHSREKSHSEVGDNHEEERGGTAHNKTGRVLIGVGGHQ